jgi:hypothetical protein
MQAHQLARSRLMNRLRLQTRIDPDLRAENRVKAQSR